MRRREDNQLLYGCYNLHIFIFNFHFYFDTFFWWWFLTHYPQYIIYDLIFVLLILYTFWSAWINLQIKKWLDELIIVNEKQLCHPSTELISSWKAFRYWIMTIPYTYRPDLFFGLYDANDQFSYPQSNLYFKSFSFFHYFY